MDIKSEWKALLLIVAVFVLAYFLPIDNTAFINALKESLWMLKMYAREHVILCLLPAFLIAGAIGVFMSKEWIGKYLGPGANKFVAYSVASVSGIILAVCSCTVLPLFAGIQKRGAGIGPASTFLYSGPAINILAIVLTMRILGFELGVARMIGAIVFSIIIGIIMHLLFGEDKKSGEFHLASTGDEQSIWKNIIFVFSLVGLLVFSNLGDTGDANAVLSFLYNAKWIIAAVFALIFMASISLWFNVKWWKTALLVASIAISVAILPGKHLIHFIVGYIGLLVIATNDTGDINEWFGESWIFTKQILPLLLGGVLVAGFLMGRPEGGMGIIPSRWISSAVGGNSLWANFAASIAGAFMYFATLTEIPILQGLLNNGMGKGPALALLLAGPAVSLPNLLVIRSIIGNKKTLVYLILVVTMSTLTGMIYGFLF